MQFGPEMGEWRTQGTKPQRSVWLELRQHIQCQVSPSATRGDFDGFKTPLWVWWAPILLYPSNGGEFGWV